MSEAERKALAETLYAAKVFFFGPGPDDQRRLDDLIKKLAAYKDGADGSK